MFSTLTVEADIGLDPDEYIELMCAVGWGRREDYDHASVAAALERYHLMPCVRDEIGVLVGFLSAFSDGVFATFIGEVAVHPSARGRGVGALLLEAVERACPGVPVFACTFRDTRGFFLRHGYTVPARPMDVLAKLNDRRGTGVA